MKYDYKFFEYLISKINEYNRECAKKNQEEIEAFVAVHKFNAVFDILTKYCTLNNIRISASFTHETDTHHGYSIFDIGL